MVECFWGAYNVWLQPFGTILNVMVYAASGERRRKIVLREVWGSLLMNDRGNWQSWLACICREKHEAPTADEIAALLDEWLSTWRRMREGAGQDTNNCDIVRASPAKGPENAAGGRPKVFHGSMFPSKHEWLSMRDHYHEHVPLLSWEHESGADKFLRWYATNSSEVQALLAEPFHFPSTREVWMFGYGSLISPDSPPHGLTERQSKMMIPYWLGKSAGYRRVWNYRHGTARCVGR